MGVSEKQQNFHFGVEYPFNERVISHLLKRLIHSKTRQVTTMNGLLNHWLTWFVQKHDSFIIKTPLCCSETQSSSAVALIELRQRTWAKTINIVLQIANFVSASLTMKNFHADDMFTCGCERKCAIKTDRLVRWGVFDLKQQLADLSDIKVPREWFKSMRSHLFSVALSRCFDVMQRSVCSALLQVEPRKGLWSNTLLSTSFSLSLSLSPPRQPPPPPKKNSSDLDDSRKWQILIQNGEFRRKATSL